jgi:tryptophan-rich hypothetical protein
MRTPLNPQQLLHSKWSAVRPQRREKHFLVTALVEPEPPTAPVEHVEIEAVLTKRTQVIPWRELKDATKWRQGW